ncbi:MAG: class I SAM-dependent methyltransferase [Desulfatitalea sp.]|nr:class I SAM-dependent methyltransferase [Desulfatitalea sp.]NNK00359.1 class I SAM-dependent methyltransferase [Desulfatitalea sp.]
MDRIYGRHKRSIYRSLPETVVEIGPGAGANFRYYKPGTRVIAIEPNTAIHARLTAKARRCRIDLNIKSIRGEQIDLPDNTANAVVGTLVLCTVQSPEQVLSEIRRILKPGGRYIFLEHVAAISGTRRRGFQERLLPVWRWLFEGCHLNRNTHQTIINAGFTDVDMNCFMIKMKWAPFSPHIFGYARN